jgi:hypothetical protein
LLRRVLQIGVWLVRMAVRVVARLVSPCGYRGCDAIVFGIGVVGCWFGCCGCMWVVLVVGCVCGGCAFSDRICCSLLEVCARRRAECAIRCRQRAILTWVELAKSVLYLAHSWLRYHSGVDIIGLC